MRGLSRLAGRGGVRVVVLLLVSLCLLAADVSAKTTYRRGRGRGHGDGGKKAAIAKVQAEIQKAEQVLALAEAKGSISQAQLASLMGRMKEAKSAIDEAEAEETQDREKMREIEQKLIKKQGSKSEIGKTKAALDAAKKALDCEKKRVLSSSACQAKLAEAKRSENAQVDAAVVEKHFLAEDESYQMALARHRRLKAKFEQLTTELFKQDPAWNEASTGIRVAQTKQKEAKQEVTKGAVHALPAKHNATTAAQLAAAARDVIARGHAKLAKLGGKAHTSGKLPTIPTPPIAPTGPTVYPTSGLKPPTRPIIPPQPPVGRIDAGAAEEPK